MNIVRTAINDVLIVEQFDFTDRKVYFFIEL